MVPRSFSERSMGLTVESAFDPRPSGELPSPLVPRPGARLFRVGPMDWLVYEDSRSYVGSSLIFESERIARRVRTYPDNWRDLTDEQLAALSLSR